MEKVTTSIFCPSICCNSFILQFVTFWQHRNKLTLPETSRDRFTNGSSSALNMNNAGYITIHLSFHYLFFRFFNSGRTLRFKRVALRELGNTFTNKALVPLVHINQNNQPKSRCLHNEAAQCWSCEAAPATISSSYRVISGGKRNA